MSNDHKETPSKYKEMKNEMQNAKWDRNGIKGENKKETQNVHKNQINHKETENENNHKGRQNDQKETQNEIIKERVMLMQVLIVGLLQWINNIRQ